MRMHKPVLEAFRRRELIGAARLSLLCRLGEGLRVVGRVRRCRLVMTALQAAGAPSVGLVTENPAVD